MTNEERWDVYINELYAYIEEHHLGPSKHTSLYNQCQYFKRKMKDGTLDREKAEELNMRRMDEHTGGRKRKTKI